MKILERVQKIPGGMMVVPLILGAIINTFFPQIIKIGGFTEALGSQGFPTLIAAYLFCVGTKMTLKAAPVMLKRGFSILFAKVGIASLIAICVAKFFGGDLWGLSALAILAAMNDTNGGMFIALTSSLGDESDSGSYVVQSIETGPFLTMLILSGSGLANIPYMAMVSVIIPIALGAILGNLDKDIRNFCAKHGEILVPFFAFGLGNNINLKSVVSAGWTGVILGFATVVITGVVCIIVDRLTGGTGLAGAAASTTAGNAAATPKAIAMADPTFAAIAPIATLQVAASVIITALLTPILTTLVYKRNQKKKAKELNPEVEAVNSIS
ncbi:2-keto-3-deoxygluconate permease [Fictibacillus sp. WQ 8-8]|uniref:2-keto-3-deoxygluconate permease n=1 Tax=Fictibacillus sp. WQ 8-8 TaxID=2938788 RepID=UPI00210C7AFB|nr:2-keto-3-deoxygluconate permease [Fictibacillus sp. WQ 8-8]MCQ6267933.1 2-keto-3-deoxygluconate permease [Fictibacillus sp. WQ 8-8]